MSIGIDFNSEKRKMFAAKVRYPSPGSISDLMQSAGHCSDSLVDSWQIMHFDHSIYEKCGQKNLLLRPNK